VHNCNTFGAQTSHKQTQTHKTHHGPNLGGSHHLPLITYFVFGHGTNTQMSFLKLGLPWFWEPIILCVDLRLQWGLKQSCSPCRELSNGMLHATCTQGNRDDSWLSMVESQIGNLTPSLSFGHNLCLSVQMGHVNSF